MNSIVEEAKKWVGYLEKASDSNLNSFTANAGDNNYTRFAVDYCSYFGESLNVYQAQPWCAMFVSVVFANVYGAGKAEEMLGGHFAYCPYGVANFKSKGIWKTSNPKPGDVIMFKDSSGTACHVGIVSEAKKWRRIHNRRKHIKFFRCGCKRRFCGRKIVQHVIQPHIRIWQYKL